ncbi:MAG: hypothetical protein K2G09_06810 [Paramuribaculum sp.]|nr:hypothetical protein [Paramuribaculum sp.]
MEIIERIKGMFKGKPRSKSRHCDYNSVEECPYNSLKECKFDKSVCHLKEHEKGQRKSNKSTMIVLVVALFGLIAYILIAIVSRNDDFSFAYSEYVYAIGGGIALSVVTGAILALVIDLPMRLKDYEQSFVNALSSNNYLKSLDETRLTNLRNQITEQLHKTKAPSMPKGLIKIDQRICELLRLPYYSRYSHTVVCSRSNEHPEYIEKEHTIEYRLVNPYSVNHQAVEFIKFTNLVLLKNGDSPNSISGLKIRCGIDGKEKEDISNRFDLKSEPIEDDFYNNRITLSDKDNPDSNGIRIEFDDNIEVDMKYKILVHESDPCFTKRLQHPAKNFRLFYTCVQSDHKLYGQIFGTELKQSDVSIKYTNNSICLETYDWLLPDNGAMVVMLKN